MILAKVIEKWKNDSGNKRKKEHPGKNILKRKMILEKIEKKKNDPGNKKERKKEVPGKYN